MHFNVISMEETNSSKNAVVDYDYIESILKKELENLEQIGPPEDNPEEFVSDDEDESVESLEAKETSVDEWDVSQYFDIVQNSTRNAQDLLSDSVEVLGTQDKEMHDLVCKKLKATLGDEDSLKEKDLLEIRNKMLAEIEELDSKEEAEFQNLKQENSNANALLPLEQVFSEDITALEEKAKEELLKLRSRQEEEFKKEKKAHDEERDRAAMEEEEYARRQRQEQESFRRKQSELEEQMKARSIQLGHIMQEKDEEIRQLDQTFQMNLESLEAQKKREEETLFRLLNEEKERKNQRRNMAATCIQKNFKGFRVRKEFGSKLESLKIERQRKEKERLDQIERVEARIKEEDERRKREELEKKQREKEERARKIEEEKRKLEEERRRLKEEEERKRREEEKRKKEEQREKLEEMERKRKEEERRIEEAERQRQEIERRKEEVEMKRREEERKREEAEKLTQEERQKEEERDKMKEMEKKRKDEENRKEEEEKKHREKEERRKSEKLAQEMEKEKRKQEEEDRKRTEKEEECKEKEERNIRDVEERDKGKEGKYGLSKEQSKDNEHGRKQGKETKAREMKGQVLEAGTEERTEVIAIIAEEGQPQLQGESEASQQGMFRGSRASDRRVVDQTSLPVSSESLELEGSTRRTDEMVTSAQDTELSLSSLPSPMNRNGIYSTENTLHAGRESYLKQLQSTWREKHHYVCARAKSSVAKASANRRKRRSTPLTMDQPLTEEMLLAVSSPGTKLHEVVYILLKDLGAISLAKLSQTPKVRLVQIENSTVKVIDGLKDCQELSELQLEKAEVECVSEMNGKSLQVLKLSGNSLSSFHGLENCRSLQVLDMSHNRLTRLNGMPLSDAMQVLNLGANQLISAKGVGFYGSLTSLNLSNNHLTTLSEVEYMPLLCSLNASGNGIQEVPNLENNALLQEVYLDNNRISNLTPLSSLWLPLLQTLTLSGNSISEVPPLRNLISLCNLDLSDNLIQNPARLGDSLSQCKSLGELKLRGNSCTADPAMRQQLLRPIAWLRKLDGEALSRKVLKDMPCHLEVQLSQQVEDWKKLHQRQNQEISSLPVQNLSVDEVGLTNMLLQSRHRTECLTLAKRHLQEQLGENMDENEKSLLTDPIEKGGEAVQNAQEITENHRGPERPANEAPIEASLYSGTCKMDSEQEKAAIKLQANIRGFLVRRKIQFVLKSAAGNGNSEDSDEFNYDEEVDLASFDFDDADLEWRAPSTPQLPQRYSVLPPTAFAQRNEMPEHREPRPAWASPQVSNEDELSNQMTLPLNDISPEDTKSLAISRVSSKRADELSSEWGFRSNATAELMLKRARRMQKSSSRQQSDADKRLAYFRKIKTAQNPDALRPVDRKKPQDRMEYFSAKARLDPPASSASECELESKQIRTFKWVHDQSVLHKDEHSELIAKHERGRLRPSGDATSPESLSLPVLNPEIIAGKRVPLVSCPTHPEVVRPARTKETNYVKAAVERMGAPVIEKAHSAPNPTERTPPVAPGSREGSARSGSADIRWRRFSYKR